MGIFGAKKIFTAQQMSRATLNASKKRGGAMENLLEKKGVAEALNEFGEQKIMHDALRARGSHGLTEKDMKIVLTQLERRGGEISSAEVKKVAKEIFGNRQWRDYSYKKEQPSSREVQALKSHGTIKKYSMPSRPRFEVRSKIQNISSSPSSRYEPKVANPVTSLGAGLSSQPARQSNLTMRPNLGSSGRLSIPRIPSIKR